jgi:hypothetical protein
MPTYEYQASKLGKLSDIRDQTGIYKKLSIVQLWQRCLVSLHIFTENNRFCFISEYAVYCRKCTLSFTTYYWQMIETFEYLANLKKIFDNVGYCDWNLLVTG